MTPRGCRSIQPRFVPTRRTRHAEPEDDHPSDDEADAREEGRFRCLDEGQGDDSDRARLRSDDKRPVRGGERSGADCGGVPALGLARSQHRAWFTRLAPAATPDRVFLRGLAALDPAPRIRAKLPGLQENLCFRRDEYLLSSGLRPALVTSCGSVRRRLRLVAAVRFILSIDPAQFVCYGFGTAGFAACDRHCSGGGGCHGPSS